MRIRIVFTLLLVTFLFQTGKAQRYIPLSEGSKEWNLLQCPTNCRTDFYWAFEDTVLGGTTYKVLDGFHFVKTVVMREDTVKQQVFLKQIGFSPLSPEVLTYDFSLQTGDSIDIKNVQAPINFNSGLFWVDSVKRIDYMGTKRKTLYLSNKDTTDLPLNRAIWVEGIGSLSIINTPGSEPDVTGIGAISCVYKDGELIFRNNHNVEDSCTSFYVPQPKDTTSNDKDTTFIRMSLEEDEQFKVFPNPSTSRLHIKSSQKGNILIHDLRGGTSFHTTFTEEENTIFIYDLTPGIYFYSAYSENAELIKRGRIEIIK